MSLRKTVHVPAFFLGLVICSLALTGCGLRPPEAPTRLEAIQMNSAVALWWNESVGATKYEVGSSTTPGGPYTPKGTATGGSFIVTGLTNETEYYFVVKAGNKKGWSGESDEASATPKPVPPPISDLTAKPGDRQVFLSWSAPAGATKYRLCRKEDPGDPWTGGSELSYTSCLVTFLQNGKTYYFTVQAGNTHGFTNYSNIVEVTPGS